MTSEVTRTLNSQRHLLSAVGHDLRTPITAMRINLEFIEDDDLRDRLLENLDELQALTEQVLGAADAKKLLETLWACEKLADVDFKFTARPRIRAAS